tara:strand:- start:437 stop:832 length:396 start_codon:yes stop_codon:yes gene_type:complete
MPKSKPPYTCHFCNYKTQYMSHFKSHLFVRKKKCHDILYDNPINCIDDYEKLKELNPDIEPRIYKCEFCDQIFDTMSQFKNHSNLKCNKNTDYNQIEVLKKFLEIDDVKTEPQPSQDCNQIELLKKFLEMD